MNDYRRKFGRVAVLGAGVMGAQIAAQLANAGVAVILYELPAEQGDPNGNVHRALKKLTKLKPAPFARANLVKTIDAANYQTDLEKLGECDLVIEAITERLDWKQELYEKIVAYLRADACLVTNTSGISIGQLAAVLPAQLRTRFCGVHFFNPPRYMHLLELVPHEGSNPDVLDELEGFLTSVVGKGVVRAKDTSSFIGNRIGIFSMLAVIHHAQRLNLPFDLVDKLTGPGIGRPKSATFRTADVVGLDTFAHVVATLHDTLPDDPWRAHYRLPGWTQALIEQGALGQKTGAGVYRKLKREIQVLDPMTGDYRAVRSSITDAMRAIMQERDISKKFQALQTLDHPQAEFVRAIFLDLFHYSAVLLQQIANSARDVDFAMRWGYGWQLGPFEIWQAAGWQAVTAELNTRIAAGQMMAQVALPAWVSDGRTGVHTAQGSWSPTTGGDVVRSKHSVYQRQLMPETVRGAATVPTITIFETDAVRMWDLGDEVAAVNFKTKLHTVNQAVIDGMLQAIDTAEAGYKALVLGQTQPPFCAGADLKSALQAMTAGQQEQVQQMVASFQQVSMRLKYSRVPTVAAVNGLALGGGCEFILHCDRIVAGLESYIGLVEVGVGLIPGGGGCKEAALRAADAACGGDVFPFLRQSFENIAMAKVSTSALEARDMGYLRAADCVVFNPHELWYVAKQQGLALFESGYQPTRPRSHIPVAGASGIATIKGQLVNMLEGGFISAHDYHIGSELARIVCGDAVDAGTEVSEAWLLQLELKVFMALLNTENTQARIQHMLNTGKPSRN